MQICKTREILGIGLVTAYAACTAVGAVRASFDAVGELPFTRRDCLRGAICAGVAAFTGGKAAGAGSRTGNEKAGSVPGKSPLIASAPVLQNAAERSMGVAFAVSADASGWVEISQSQDMSGARRVYSGALGMMEVNDRIAQILVRGLKPSTKYWYRIGADRIEYTNGYRMKNRGSEVDGNVHSFATLGTEAQGSFCIINDTHDQKPVLDAVFTKLAELKPSVVIWNGGGCEIRPGSKTSFPSVVEGRVEGGRLVVKVHNCTDGTVMMKRDYDSGGRRGGGECAMAISPLSF